MRETVKEVSGEGCGGYAGSCVGGNDFSSCKCSL